MNFSERLVELRNDRDIKQKDIAALLNASASTPSHYELGIHAPDINALIKLADYFDVTLDYLVGRSNAATPWSTLSKPIELSRGDIHVDELLHEISSLPIVDRDDLMKYLMLLKTKNLHAKK